MQTEFAMFSTEGNRAIRTEVDEIVSITRTAHPTPAAVQAMIDEAQDRVETHFIEAHDSDVRSEIWIAVEDEADVASITVRSLHDAHFWGPDPVTARVAYDEARRRGSA